MRKLLFFILIISFLLFSETKKVNRVDISVDIGNLKGEKYLHSAIYNVLKKKGISCYGLRTTKGGKVIIKKASSSISLTKAEIQEEINKIKEKEEIEKKIQEKEKEVLRKLAIEELKKNGEIPQDYK